MKANFLMVNYNDYANVKKMIDRISAFQVIDKIVIVDNHSTDDSLDKMKELESEKIIVLESARNGGYGYGINIGVKYLNQIDPDCYIIISNTDIVIDSEKDICTLLETFDCDTAVVAPMIKEHTGYNCGWKVPTPWQDIVLSIPGIYKKYQRKLHYRVETIQNNITEVEAVSGSFFLIKGSVLERVGYFDENIFLYYEENVLATKLQQIGKKTVINGNIEVFHNHSVTIDKVHTSIQKYENLKKSQYYFQKVYNHAGIFNRMTMRFVFALVSIGLRIKR